MPFVFFTSLEIIMAITLIIEIKNKEKLVVFERKLIKYVRRKIRKRLMSGKICHVSERRPVQELRRSA